MKKTTDLWNQKISPRDYSAEAEKYQQALIEQYKIYVEMADRVSSRRGLTNTFFLTSNSAFVVLASPALSNKPVSAPWVLLVLVALASQCAIWFSLLGSYRRLSSTKYRTVGQMEERLPARPWAAEWSELGTGTGIRRYWRLGLLERWVPLVFLLVYMIAATYSLTRI